MLRLIQRGEPLPTGGLTRNRFQPIRDGMADRPDNICEECGSSFIADTSAMSALCPECAHHLHGYQACEHRFAAGRCEKCGWDGSMSPYVASLTGRGKTLG